MNNFPEEYRGGGSVVPLQAFGDREGKRVQHVPEPEISESRNENSLQSVPLRVNQKSVAKKQHMPPINQYEEEPYIEEEQQPISDQIYPDQIDYTLNNQNQQFNDYNGNVPNHRAGSRKQSKPRQYQEDGLPDPKAAQAMMNQRRVSNNRNPNNRQDSLSKRVKGQKKFEEPATSGSNANYQRDNRLKSQNRRARFQEQYEQEQPVDVDQYDNGAPQMDPYQQ